MRNIQGFIVLTIMLFITFSCGELLLPPLRVVSISVESDIVIVFSAKPSEESIKKAFSITENGIAISGTFSFDSDKFIFKPTNGLRDYCEYLITISTVAEDEKGNSLLTDYQYHFYTKQDITPPAILSITPSDESNLSVHPERITIYFSEPVDTDSFSNAFNITPASDYLFKWNDDKSIVDVMFVKPLSKGTRYTITVNKTLTDIHNNTLLNPFTSTFVYGLDSLAPEISVSWLRETDITVTGSLSNETQNADIPSDIKLVLDFDKEILIETIGSFIEFNPSISISIAPDILTRKRAVISFSEKPEWNQAYSLILKGGITDIFGNYTKDNSVYKLLFSNEKFRPVVYAGGCLDNKGSYETINPETDFSTITLDVLDFPPVSGSTVAADLYFAFNISSQADSLSLVSAMQAISISSTNACVYISIRTMKILSDSEYKSSPLYTFVDNSGTNGKICALKMGIDVENSSSRGLITFTIRRQIADNWGNTMNEDSIFTYNKQ